MTVIVYCCTALIYFAVGIIIIIIIFIIITLMTDNDNAGSDSYHMMIARGDPFGILYLYLLLL